MNHKTAAQRDYEQVAIETGPASDPVFQVTLEDLEPALVNSAFDYAREHDLPWPPLPVTEGWQVTIYKG